jgi:hypothetical protein
MSDSENEFLGEEQPNAKQLTSGDIKAGTIISKDHLQKRIVRLFFFLLFSFLNFFCKEKNFGY